MDMDILKHFGEFTEIDLNHRRKPKTQNRKARKALARFLFVNS